MKKHDYFIIKMAVLFLLISFVLYSIHYLIFRDLNHIFIFMLGELAFLPLEVLLVVLLVERLLARREQNNKLLKMNMVIGAFFSELGTYLLHSLLDNFRNKTEISKHMNVSASWSQGDFQKAAIYARNLPLDVDLSNLQLVQLREFLIGKRVFLLMLLENPSLLEHDRFADLLWSVTHLIEELEARQLNEKLPAADMQHLISDIRRMYINLAGEWLAYSEHLKNNYPYLFSLILRTHPFQEHPSPTVR